MPLIIEKLRIQYPGELVFADVDLRVEDNEIVAIRSHILDGGTSFLRAIGGFLNGVGGEVIFRGYNLLEPTPRAINYEIGYVYESHGLVGMFTALENMLLPMQFHTDLTEREMLERVGTLCDLFSVDESVFQMRPWQLNDVQTRMVNLVRALAPEPGLLLIDELEGGMPDDRLIATMAGLRACQANHDISIVMTTASDVILSRADRVFAIAGTALTPEQGVAHDSPAG